MNRCILFFVVAFSVFGFASNETLTSLPEGVYLGEGWYVTSSGSKGSYSSYADVFSDEWKTAYMRDGEIFRYNAIFSFTEDGFFDVNVIQHESENMISFHQGLGYCTGHTCHISVELTHGYLEETVTFIIEEDRIKMERLGSIHYIDENDNDQIIKWKEHMMRLEL
jgi:hypothetical protein